jgi:hypothetical protein
MFRPRLAGGEDQAVHRSPHSCRGLYYGDGTNYLDHPRRDLSDQTESKSHGSGDLVDLIVGLDSDPDFSHVAGWRRSCSNFLELCCFQSDKFAVCRLYRVRDEKPDTGGY